FAKRNSLNEGLRKPTNQEAPAHSVVVQPTLPSVKASCSSRRMASGRSSAKPPRFLGTKRLNSRRLWSTSSCVVVNCPLDSANLASEASIWISGVRMTKLFMTVAYEFLPVKVSEHGNDE